MHTNDLIVNDRSARQTIKSVAKLFPHFDGKATAALVVKAVDAVDTSALVVAAQEKEVFGVLDFVSKN